MMVAIFTGAGTGLDRSSIATLGAAGQIGRSRVGQAQRDVYVNAATGNLVIETVDEFLVGRGPDLTVDFDHNSIVDGSFLYSFLHGLKDFTGTPNTVGSTVTRWTGDSAVYTYDAGRGAYLSREGGGAYDEIRYANNVWSWTDGDTGRVEYYEYQPFAGKLNLTRLADGDGNTQTYAYSGNMIQTITMPSGEKVSFDWSDGKIVGINELNASGATTKRTILGWDTAVTHRLLSITVDLTPADNSTADGKTYVTTFTFDGSSRRVASMTQSDGSRIDATYVLVGAEYRVATLTQTEATGVTRATSFSYDTVSRVTTVTDAHGQATQLWYDAQGQLTRIVSPPAVSGGAVQNRYFAYNANGDVVSVTDGSGDVTSFSHDSNGNMVLSRDALGNTMSRTYGSRNELLTETRWLVPDPDGSGVASAGTPETTRYAYDAENHLRFVVTAEGRVTEYRYTAAGEVASSLQYTANTYNVSALGTTTSIAEATLATWAAGVSDKTSIKRTDTTYDLRGNVSMVTSYSRTLADGTGDLAAIFTRQTYVYDPAGKLLSRSTSGVTGTELFVYDGLGRVISTTDTGGAATTVTYADATATTTITLANGLTTTTVRNKAGEMLSETRSATSIATATDSYKYDRLGRLRMATDATGRTTHHLYDNRGRTTAKIAADGALTEYIYDADDRLVATAGYLNKLSAAQLATLVDASGNPTNVAVASVRPAANANDSWEWRVYDRADRLIETIDAAGRVTAYSYDGAGQLVATTSYANTLAAATVAAYKTTPPSALTLPAAHALDRTTRSFYDKDGRLVGILNAAGALSQIVYDSAGQKVREFAYANLTTASLRASGTFAQLLSSVGTNAGDHRVDYVYDQRGIILYTVDAAAHAIKIQHDTAGRFMRSVSYNGSITAASSYTFGYVESQTAALGLQNDTAKRITRAVYDGAGRLAFEFDGASGVTGYTYDNVGNLIKTVAYQTPYPDTTDPTFATMQSWATARAGDAGNRVTRQVVDALGRVAYLVDAEGHVTEQRYDAVGRVTQSIRYADSYAVADGVTKASLAAQIGALPATAAVTSYAYDAAGRVSDVTDAGGGVAHYVYDALGRVVDQVAAYGTVDQSTTRYAYDAAGRVTSETRAHGTGVAAATSYAYDGLDNLLTVTDPRGSLTTRQYDARGRLLSETRQIDAVTSTTTTYGYNAFDQVVQKSDGRNNPEYFYYDALGRQTLHVDRERYATRTNYNPFGETASLVRYAARTTGTPTATTPPTIVTGTGDATTSFLYDNAGRLTRTTDAEGHYEQYTLNAFGDRTSVRNKIGGIITNSYDRRGLLVAETLPMASVNSSGTTVASSVTNKFEYDGRGNRTKMIEAFGLTEARTTTYIYDKADRLTETRGDAVNVTSQVNHVDVSSVVPTEKLKYDVLGRTIERTDALGARTLYYYDQLGRPTVAIDALGTYSGTTYDKNGNVLTQRIYGTAVALPANAGGSPPAPPAGEYREFSYTYDKLDRMKTATIANVRIGAWNGSFYATSIGTVTTSYDYDANGNLIKTTDGAGGTVFNFYDKANHKVAQVDAENYLTFYTLNGDGNVTQEERLATKLAGTVTAASDPVALRAGIAGAAADRITQFGYDRNGRRISEWRLYIWSNNVGGTGALGTDGVHGGIQYNYNGLGQIWQKTFGNGDYVSFIYDSTGRLIQESRSPYTDMNGATVRPTTFYYYNGVNNLTASRQGGLTPAAGDRFTRYTYGAGGRLTTMTDAAGGAYDYQYDAAGNVVRESWVRQKSDGTSVTDGLLYTRDLLGRVTSQALANKPGASWVKGDSQDSAYNAYGEVHQRGVNGLWQEKFAFDGAGRMWRSNAGDGVWRYFGYDGAGRQTLVLESEGTNLADLTMEAALGVATANGAYYVGGAYIDGINATISVFDKRGLATQSRTPKRQLDDTAAAQDLTVSRSYNAFGEVASETDARGYTTDFTYNTMGRLTQKKSPTVNHTGENGVVASARPTEDYYYDRAGRLIGVRDANGNLVTLALLAGTGHDGSEALVTYEYHSDGGYLRNAYDLFGDKRSSWDEINRRTDMAYDAMGRVTQVTRPNGLIDSFGYDILGQKIAHWNNLLQTPVYGPPEQVWVEDPPYWDPYYGYIYPGTGHYETQTPIIGYAPDKELTDYDAQGRVTRQVAFGGDTTTTSYVWSATIATTGMGTFGGWTETTTMANGRVSTEKTDLFGRQVYKSDLGGHVFNFSYDLAGRMVQRSGGETITYTWLNTGKVAQSFSMTGTYASQNWTRRGTTYGYDASGNLVSERLQEDGEEYYMFYWTPYEPDWHHATWSRVYKNGSATYDSLNRMASWTEAGSADMASASTTYEYDLAGNIRRSRAVYRPIDHQGVQAAYTSVQDNWYRYDSLNRLVTKGELSGGQIVRGSAGADYVYDKAGQRVSSTRTSQAEAYVYNPYYYYDPYDPYGYGNQYMVVYYNADTREDYAYDAGGALLSVRIAQGGYTDNGDGTVTPTAAPAYGALRASYTNDLMGRVTRQIDWLGDGTSAAYDRTASYNAKGQVYSETVVQKQGADTITTYTSNDFGTGASYALGSIVYSGSSIYKNGAYQNGTSTTNSYVWYDGPVQSQISYKPNTAQSTTYTTTFTYDGSGVLASIYVGDGRPRTVTFVNDANGQAIKRDESDNNYNASTGGDPHEIWHRFGGKQMGSVGNNGTLDTDYATSITNRTRTPGTGAFRFGTTYASMTADFDLSNEAITSYSQGVGAGSYVVRTGDTLETIAAQLWGDSSLWYQLADANGLSMAGGLAEGQRLIIPAGVMKNHHNASTFKPFDPADTLGDINPTTPKPQKGKRGGKCGVFGQILLVVIAVAVSAITYGALTGPATGLLGTIAAGAVSGAAGSIASQAVGVATGIQDKFSWKGVAMAAIGGAVGGGLGKVGGFLGADKFLSNVARGALSSAMTQGIGVATGLQKKFDWVGVAAAGLGAGVAGAVARELGVSPTHIANGVARNAAFYTNQAISGMAGAIANAAARSLVQGTDFGDNILAALPDVIGTTIGNMIADPIVANIAEAKQQRAAEAAFREIAMTPQGQAVLQLIGITDRAPTARDLLNYLSFNPQNLGVREATELFGRNIEDWIRRASGIARQGGGDFTDGIMAQNFALRVFYAALATEMPHFQWTAVGGVVAGQVGEELLRMGGILRTMEMSSGAVGDAITGIMPGGDIIQGGLEAGKAAITHIMGRLIEGQIDVVTDIGKYALAYDRFGAAAVASSADSPLVRLAFRYQAQSDAARGRGDLTAAASLGRDAAFRLGIHEQQRLQGMWNDPIVQMSARGGDLVGLVTTDIRTPVGTIVTPEGLRGGPWDLDYRIAIARNAFNFMHDRVFSPAAGSSGSSRMNDFFRDVFSSGRLRWATPPDRRT